MDVEEERIRERIAEHEAALKTKVNLLKGRVERIKQATDIKVMVGDRPVLMFAGSVITGFLAKKILSRRHAENGAYRALRRDLEHNGFYVETRPRSSGKLKDQFMTAISVVAGRIAMNALSDLARRMIPGKSDARRAERELRRENHRA